MTNNPYGNLSNQDMERMMSRYKQQLLQLQKAQRPTEPIPLVESIPEDVLVPEIPPSHTMPVADPVPEAPVEIPLEEIAEPLENTENPVSPSLAPKKDLLQIIQHYPYLTPPEKQTLAYNLSCDLSRCPPIIIEGFMSYVLTVSTELGESMALHLNPL